MVTRTGTSCVTQHNFMLGVLFVVTRTRTGIDNFMGGSIILYFLRPIFLSVNVFQGEGVLFVTELLLICGVGVDMVEKSTRWVGYGGDLNFK